MTLNEDSSVVFLGYFQPPCHSKKDVLRDFFPSNLLRKILQDFMQICKNLLICETYLVVSQAVFAYLHNGCHFCKILRNHLVGD